MCSSMAENPSSIVIDEAYEFSAPQFFDFIDGETDEMAREAELWFISAHSCAPSPILPRMRPEIFYNIKSMCDFWENQGEKKSKSNCPQQTKPREEVVRSRTQKKEEKETDLTNRVTDCKVVSQENMAISSFTKERDTNVKKLVGTPNFAQENQAIKGQKLEGGRTRQILNPKPRALPHKSKVGLSSGSSNL